jgi:glycine/D-amino acid oxidase-like deaminating enzyme
LKRRQSLILLVTSLTFAVFSCSFPPQFRAKITSVAHQTACMPSTPNWGKTPWTISFRAKKRPLPSRVDIAIIGGGFTGLAAAAIVKRLAPKKSVVLFEAGCVGNGASGRTGGMALAETAAGNLPGLGDVLKGYKKILRDLRIGADLELPGVWEIARGTRSMEGKTIRPLRNSAIQWQDNGLVRAVKKVPGGTVHPGKVVAGLARAAERFGAAIFEDAEVVGFQPKDALELVVRYRGKKCIVRAGRALFATNAGGTRISGMPESAQAKLTFGIATGPMTHAQLRALGLADGRPFYTVDLPYLWGRLFDRNRIIFGSGLVPAWGESVPNATRDYKKLWSGLEKVNFAKGEAAERLRTLEDRVRNFHPVLKNVKITHHWGGPILITDDFHPIFCRNPKTDRALMLGGFSGHGVALSVYLGEWAALALVGKRKLPDW